MIRNGKGIRRSNRYIGSQLHLFRVVGAFYCRIRDWMLNLSLLHGEMIFYSVSRLRSAVFFFFGERKRVAVTWARVRPIDRRYETSPRRNSSRVSPLHAAQLQHLCLPRSQRPDWKSSFSRRPRHARSPIPRGAPLALAFPCSPLPATGAPLSATGGNNVRGSREPREPDRADFLPLRRDVRRWRTEMNLRENRSALDRVLEYLRYARRWNFL